MRKLLFLLIAISLAFSVKAQLDAKEKNAAMAAVRVNQKSLGLDNGDLNNMEVVNSYVDGQSGTRYVYLIQTYNNIPVYNQIQVLSFKGDKLLSKAGGRIPLMEEKMKGKSALPKLSASSAVLAALTDRKITGAKTPIVKSIKDNNRKIEFDNLGVSKENITAALMWVPEKNSQIIHLAWQIFVVPNTSPDTWLVSVDAENSAVVDVHNFTNYDHWEKPADNKTMEPKAAAQTSLSNKNNLSAVLNVPRVTTANQQLKPLTVDGASYRVIPFPAESPIAAGGTPALVTNPWTMVPPGNATTLKWHTGAGGTDYNYTRGNNVWAYQDRESNNTGTVAKSASSTTGTAPLNFDFTPDFTVDPTQTSPVQNQQFAVTNLFYWNNIVHDVMYQYGFTEGAANFQDDNLQRGGQGNDHVNAEAQDGGGLNNANFYTPPDGTPGRMQMYLFNPKPSLPTLHINTPLSITGNYTVNSISPYILLSDLGSLTGDVVYYDDGDNHLACYGAINNNLKGKIALINRGICYFETKVRNAESLGAIGVIVIDNQPGLVQPGIVTNVSIPAVIISSTDGASIVNNLAQGVNITLSAAPSSPNIDGDLDNSVVIHEYGHGISNRLTGGGIASCLNNAEQMGEGWSDYYALMFTQDWANSNLTSGFANPRGLGAYAISSSSGVRNYKYCTDFSVNPLVYLDVLPYETHDIGEIWCAALWEMTWAIIQQEGIINPNIYAPANGGGNTIAMKLVTEGMKLQPCRPGFIDGRDAIIQADRNLYGGTHVLAIREAFRKRGMGFGASQGSSNFVTDQTPSFASFPLIKATANLTDFITCAGTASKEQTISVEGTNLTDSLIITAPGGFEVSTVSGTNFNSRVAIAATNGAVNATIYIRLSVFNTTNSAGNVLFDLTDAYNMVIRVNGILTGDIPIFHLVNTICFGYVAPLLPLVSDNGIQGTWNPSVASNTTSGTYTFTPANASNCATFHATITVNPILIFSGTVNISTTQTCLGSKYTVTYTGGILSSKWQSYDDATAQWYDYLPTYNNNPLPIIAGYPSSTSNGLPGDKIRVKIPYGDCFAFSNVVEIGYLPLPSVSFTGLPTSVCVSSGSIILVGSPANGTFKGNGMTGNSFNPGTAGTGSSVITYSFTDGNGCSNNSSQTVVVNPLPTVSFIGLPAATCFNNGSITLVGSPTGGTFSGNGMTGNSFDPSTAGTGSKTITYTFTDGNGCSNISSQTVVVNPLTVISGSPVSQAINALNNATFSVIATGTSLITYQWQQSTDGGASFNNLSDAGVYSGTGTNTLGLSVVPISMTGYQYRCMVTGLCGTATSTAATLTVSKRPTVITYTGDNKEQYSDQQTLTAVLIDKQSTLVLSGKTVSFSLGTQSATGITNTGGVAATTLMMYQNVGSYNVISSFAGDATYDISSATNPFNITKENAITDYTGPEFISVPCATCTTTSILLSASVRDTTAVYPLNDIYPGDIRKARVKFINLNGGANISDWLTPGLVSATDTTRGIVSFNWTVTLPSTSYDSYSIGVVVDNTGSAGNYIGSTQSVLSVSRSSLTEFITGGGDVIPTGSNGQYASDAGRKLNFGFNVKYNKSNTNLQGNMNVIFRRGGRVYQIKSTSLSGLSINSINPCSKKAIFSSKANLTDITNPALPVSIYGGITLQVTMTDNGDPGNTDMIGITLLNGNSLVYSSNWVSTKTTELVLNGGNVVIRNGVNCIGNNFAPQTSTITPEVLETISSISVKAYPNPFSNHTTISYTLPEAMQISLTVYDSKGQKLALLAEGKMSAGRHETRLNGSTLAAGIYLYFLQAVDAKGRINTLKGKMVLER